MRSTVIFDFIRLFSIVACSNYKRLYNFPELSGPGSKKPRFEPDVRSCEVINQTGNDSFIDDTPAVSLSQQQLSSSTNNPIDFLLDDCDFSLLNDSKYDNPEIKNSSNLFLNEFQDKSLTASHNPSKTTPTAPDNVSNQQQDSPCNLIISDYDWKLLIKNESPSEELINWLRSLYEGEIEIPLDDSEVRKQEEEKVSKDGQLNSESNPQSNTIDSELNLHAPDISQSLTSPNYIFTCQNEEIESKGFKFDFYFNWHKKFKIYFGTNDLKVYLIFIYSHNIFCLLDDEDQNSTFEQFHLIISEEFNIILSSISSFDSTIKPFYYLFGATHIKQSRSNYFLRIPYYFLFTSLSYLIQNEEIAVERNSFVDLVKQTYIRMRQSGIFSKYNWKFLNDYFENNLKVSNEIRIIKSKTFQYDISTVSFIYKEMKFGGNMKVRLFFKQVWNTNKNDCPERFPNQICDKPLINTPIWNEFNVGHWEFSARKLYQMKFIEMLFGEWERVDDLLKEYRKLRSDFDSFLYDFRLRIFNLIDFELLDKSLEKIDPLLARYSFGNKKKEMKIFFTELKCFINFKCILFTRDFCLNVKKIKNSEIYRLSFILIKSIYEKFEKIQKTLNENGIVLGKIKYENIKLDDSFEQIIEHLPIESFNLESIQETYEFKQLFLPLSPLVYFDTNLSRLPLLTRFEFNEYLTEFKGYLRKNDEKGISEIFTNEKYREIRKLGFDKYEKYFSPSSQKNPSQYKFSFEEKKILLYQFIQFLIIYIQ